MADSRFFTRAGPFLLGEIAEAVGGDLPDEASAAVRIVDVAPLDTARANDISVFTGGRYRDAFIRTKAAAIVTAASLAARGVDTGLLLYVKQPRLAFARIGRLFYPGSAVEPGIDEAARIHASATIGDDARIEAGAVVGAGAQLGARCHIAHNAVIGPGVVLGDDVSIGANSSVSYALLGNGVRVASCVTIGSEGFGFIPGPTGPFRILQLGRVIIEDDVEIGANCAIDRGSAGDTVIGMGSVLDNLVQIGHNVVLGRYCVISGQAGIAGSTVVGDGVMIGGQAAVSDHLHIGAGARIAGKSGVMRDVPAGGTVAGYPAVAVRQWHRQTASITRLVSRGRDVAE
jgi:UDP-3-O-[3-hydroxymyristoyl] glucosamine N-acyltransferase